MGALRCLVLGSYPPVPGEAAAATVAAVRRAWAAGAEVVVASPRPSAAQLVLLGHGGALAREVIRLLQEHGCTEVVLCIEPGWPLVPGVDGREVGEALARSLGRAARSELVISGGLSQWSPVIPAVAPLLLAAQLVTTSNGALEPLLRPRSRAVRSLPVTVPEMPPFTGRAGPLEPGELLLSTRARRFAGRNARRLLGEREPQVRRLATRALKRLRH